MRISPADVQTHQPLKRHYTTIATRNQDNRTATFSLRWGDLFFVTFPSLSCLYILMLYMKSETFRNLNSTDKRTLVSMHSAFRMGHLSTCTWIPFPRLISTFQNLVVFGALFFFAFIELSIAAWITAKYNANHNFLTSSARTRVRYLLFMSTWIIVFGMVYLVGFLVAESSILASVGSHFFLYVLSHSTCHRVSYQPNSHLKWYL